MSRSWRRNLWFVWIAEFLAIMGFSSSHPIWSYYIQSLGADPDSIARWSGIVISVSSISMGIMGPIWGTLSDRYGRKMMVMRAMFGGAVIIGLMGFAQTPSQLALLRFVQGALTGTVSAATAMVASQTPKERLGSTLGLLQLAIYLGQSLGPTTGGFVADILGYRATFWLTAVYLTVSGLIVLFFVKEQFTPSPDALQGKLFSRLKMDFRLVAGSTLALVLGLRFALRIGLNMKGPVVPLIVAELIPADRFLGSASGFLSTISGISSALIAPLMGRLTERGNIRWLLLGSSTVAAVGMIGQAFAPTYWLMVAAEVFLGFGIGGTLATISTTLGRLAPEGRTGVVFGLDTLAVSLSGAIGPSAGGMLGDLVSLRAPLFVGGLATMAAGLGVFRLPRELDKRPEPTKMPAEAA